MPGKFRPERDSNLGLCIDGAVTAPSMHRLKDLAKKIEDPQGSW